LTLIGSDYGEHSPSIFPRKKKASFRFNCHHNAISGPGVIWIPKPAMIFRDLMEIYKGFTISNAFISHWWFGTFFLFFHVLGIIIPND